VNYSKAFYQLKDQVKQGNNNEIIWEVFSKHPETAIIGFFENREDNTSYLLKHVDKNLGNLAITKTGTYVAFGSKSGDVTTDQFVKDLIASTIKTFYFNKATGKKITTNFPPSPAYPGNGGAFGLVNGVRADKFAHPEWLGWSGKEVEINIDFGKTEMIHEIVLHVWKQEASWIYLPYKVELMFHYKEGDNDNFSSMEIEQPAEGWGEDRNLKFNFEPKMVSSVTIKLTPLMKIPEGRQGAGRPAWVFVDEVEIN
jgi:hexosaminidase